MDVVGRRPERDSTRIQRHRDHSQPRHVRRHRRKDSERRFVLPQSVSNAGVVAWVESDPFNRPDLRTLKRR